MKTSRRSFVNKAALAMAVVLVVSACQSDPSAKRVAEDLVSTLADTPAQEECMLEVIDGYTTDELEDLGNDSLNGDQAEQAEANSTLDKFEADLAACR